MANIREVLSKNMREYRYNLSITQAELAEKANVSINFIAMIELMHKFPSPDVLDRIATALCVETHTLFAVPTSNEEAMRKLQQVIKYDLDKSIENAIDAAIDKKLNKILDILPNKKS